MKNLMNALLLTVALVTGCASWPAHAVDQGAAYQVLRVPPTGGLPKFGALDLSQAAACTNTLPFSRGGFGISTATSGGIPYFASSSTVASSAALTANRIVLGGGAGAAPTVVASLGTTSTVLHGNAAGAPTFGTIVNADVDAAAGIVDTKLATISTAGKVANSATTATSANTAGAIVARDGSGNFSGGTFTGDVTGNVSGTAGSVAAFTSNPTDCGSDTYATTIAANGNLTCATVTNAGLAGSIAASKLIGTDITSLANLATVGTITSGTWSGTIVGQTKGGTGINNAGTLTYGSNNVTLTTTGTTSVTLPVAGSLLSTGASSVERIERAVVTTSSSGTVCTVNSQSGTWLGAPTPGASTGICTLNFTGSPFSAAPTCIGSAVQTGNNRIITIDTATTSLVKFYRTDGGTPADGAMNIICMGPK